MGRWHRRAPLAVALAATVVLASACADEAPSEPAAGTGPDGGQAATGTSTPTGATATGGGAGGYGGGGGRYDYGSDDDGGDDMGGGGAVTLTADDFAFDPVEIELAAGSEISVKNASESTPHTFTVDGTDIDLELDPGGVESATLDVEAGEYAFACRFHAQMTGTLTVS